MYMEHIALNIPDALGMANWYVAHAGMVKVRGMGTAPYTHFLADATGRIVFELYTNPDVGLPSYKEAHPMTFHIAFAVADPAATTAALVAAGATEPEETHAPDGSFLVMMRDPWGIPLQLCRRGTPLFA